MLLSLFGSDHGLDLEEEICAARTRCGCGVVVFTAQKPDLRLKPRVISTVMEKTFYWLFVDYHCVHPCDCVSRYIAFLPHAGQSIW